MERYDPDHVHDISLILFDVFWGVDEQQNLLQTMIVEHFSHYVTNRDYIFYNVQRMVQGRQVLIDLSSFTTEQSDLASWLEQGIVSIQSAMAYRPPPETDAHAVYRSQRSRPLSIAAFKWQDLKSLSHCESVTGVIFPQSHDQDCIGACFPSYVYIFGPPKGYNAGLTPLECFIVKIAYIPGTQTNLTDSSWYREESLLKEFVYEIDDSRPDLGTGMAMLAWFFNSQAHFRECLFTAVSRARTHFETHPDALPGTSLPPLCGINAEHILYIRYDADLASAGTLTANRVYIHRSQGKLRHAAVLGQNQFTMGDMVERRLVYLNSFAEAEAFAPDLGLNNEFFPPVVFAACRAKLYGSSKWDHLAHLTFSQFLQRYPLVDMELTKPEGETSLTADYQRHIFGTMVNDRISFEEEDRLLGRKRAAAPVVRKNPPLGSGGGTLSGIVGRRPPTKSASHGSSKRQATVETRGLPRLGAAAPPQQAPVSPFNNAQVRSPARAPNACHNNLPPHDGRPRYIRKNPVSQSSHEKGKRHVFSPNEVSALLDGRNRYRGLTHIWPLILTDPDYGPILSRWSNTQLSDKFKYLKAKGQLRPADEW